MRLRILHVFSPSAECMDIFFIGPIEVDAVSSRRPLSHNDMIQYSFIDTQLYHLEEIVIVVDA